VPNGWNVGTPQQQAQQAPQQFQQQAQQYAQNGAAGNVDTLWANVVRRISNSPLAGDAQVYADMSAAILTSFGSQSQSYAALVDWSNLYSQQAQLQMQGTQQAQNIPQIQQQNSTQQPDSNAEIEQLLLQQPTTQGIFVAGKRKQ
jgi:hypothetical protein